MRLFFYINGENYSLKSTPKGRFLRLNFHGNFIYFQSFGHKSAEEQSFKNFFFVLLEMSDLELIQGIVYS